MIGFSPGRITSGGFLLFIGFLIGNRCDIIGAYGKAFHEFYDEELDETNG